MTAPVPSHSAGKPSERGACASRGRERGACTTRMYRRRGFAIVIVFALSCTRSFALSQTGTRRADAIHTGALTLDGGIVQSADDEVSMPSDELDSCADKLAVAHGKISELQAKLREREDELALLREHDDELAVLRARVNSMAAPCRSEVTGTRDPPQLSLRARRWQAARKNTALK